MQGDASEDAPQSDTASKPCSGNAQPAEEPLPILPCPELLRLYPERRPAVIDGLLRQGETLNLIAAPKVGKSWLALGLAFSVATGTPWLDTFPTVQGRVLLIDNELHRETIAHRLRLMARELDMGDDVLARIDVLSVRGRLVDLNGLGAGLRQFEQGRYALILIDAWYRTLPSGTDENDNAAMAGLYNLLDQYAAASGSSFALIHHQSKGSQSSKAVTDVGSGAGSMSRAADTHLILRPHEEPNAAVLEAAVRSWQPVAPRCLRWSFPLWTPAPDLDPTALRQERPRRNKVAQQDEPPKTREAPWTGRRFAETFGKPEPQTRSDIIDAALLAGVSDRKIKELFKGAVESGYLFTWKENGPNPRQMAATVQPPVPTPEVDPTSEAVAATKPKRPRGRPPKKK